MGALAAHATCQRQWWRVSCPVAVLVPLCEDAHLECCKTSNVKRQLMVRSQALLGGTPSGLWPLSQATSFFAGLKKHDSNEGSFGILSAI